jgi:hypothetical protein
MDVWADHMIFFSRQGRLDDPVHAFYHGIQSETDRACQTDSGNTLSCARPSPLPCRKNKNSINQHAENN